MMEAQAPVHPAPAAPRPVSVRDCARVRSEDLGCRAGVLNIDMQDDKI